MMQAKWLFAEALLSLRVCALQLFPPDSVTNFPSACGAVLSQNITSCNNLVEVFDTSTDYLQVYNIRLRLPTPRLMSSQADLEQACTANCSSALSSWFSQASTTCSNVTYVDDYGFTQGAASV